MGAQTSENNDSNENASKSITEKSDTVITYSLLAFFVLGFVFSFFHNTYIIPFSVGGLCLVAYFSTKALFPRSNLYQCIASTALVIFSAQFVFQMQGMYEMHFFFLLAAVFLIAYQNWKLYLPLLAFFLLYHTAFLYLQHTDQNPVVSQLDYADIPTVAAHQLLS